ncbi:DUF4399 domain-containing protein [Denitromonas halophila]|nr:DUF4399 domain-containing protein [Denitromonas halophila]
MTKIHSLIVAACATALSSLAMAGGSVHFVEPVDGASVAQEFTVKMGVEGIKVQPAGALMEGTGHHHLIINGKPVAAGVAVPADDTHLHFGKGQTETTLKLMPGQHTLTLQFADGLHQSYGPDMSRTITITVK